jgi:hypothetical protein
LTVYDPAVEPAVKRPPVVIDPPVAVHVTGGLETDEPSVFVPETVNCCVEPALMLNDAGEIAIDFSTGADAVTVPETEAAVLDVLNESMMTSEIVYVSTTVGVHEKMFAAIEPMIPVKVATVTFEEFLIVQTAYHGFVLPTEKEPVGSSVIVVPTATEKPPAGDLMIAVGAAGAATVTTAVAVPEIDVPTAVAVIVTVTFDEGAVKTPAPEMVPAVAAHDTETDCVVPSERTPTAENCCN